MAHGMLKLAMPRDKVKDINKLSLIVFLFIPKFKLLVDIQYAFITEL